MNSVATGEQQSALLPLTYQQLFFWKYFNIEAGGHRLDTFVLRIIGPLNVDVLRRCFDQVVGAHDSLRARVVVVDGVPRWRPDQPSVFDLHVTSLVNEEESQRELLAAKLIEEFSLRRCDLAVGPVFEVQLIRLSDTVHLLAWAIHHLVSDAVSVKLLFSEVWTLYAASPPESQRPRKVTPPQYGDYAKWQRATDLEWESMHRAHWERRLAAATSLQWPSANGDAMVVADETVAVEIEIPAAARADLRRVAQRARTTVAMVVAALYVVVAADWCKQRRFTLPMNFAGRHRAEHEYIIGYFAQLLYLDIRLATNETFLEIASKIGSEFSQAVQHQDFGRVALQAPHVLAGALFSWSPPLEKLSVPPASLAADCGLAIEQVPFKQHPNGSLDLQGIGITFYEAEGTFWGRAWCRRGIYAQGEVARFVADFLHVATEVATNPAQQMSHIFEQRREMLA